MNRLEPVLWLLALAVIGIAYPTIGEVLLWWTLVSIVALVGWIGMFLWIGRRGRRTERREGGA